MKQNRILFVKEAHIHLFLIIFGGLWNLGLTNNQLLCHMGFLAYKLIYSILCKQYYLQSALTEEPPIISLYFVSTQPDFLVIFKEWSWAIVLLTFWWSFNVFFFFGFFFLLELSQSFSVHSLHVAFFVTNLCSLRRKSPSITKRHLNQGILNCIYKHFVTGASHRITKLIAVCIPIAISWKCGVSQCVLKKCQQNWKVSCHETILKERNQDKRLRYSNIHENWAESVKTFLKRWIQI